MMHIYDDRVVLQKLDQAIEDLTEVPGEGSQKLRDFLREVVVECREQSRAYDEKLLRQLSQA